MFHGVSAGWVGCSVIWRDTCLRRFSQLLSKCPEKASVGRRRRLCKDSTGQTEHPNFKLCNKNKMASWDKCVTLHDASCFTPQCHVISCILKYCFIIYCFKFKSVCICTCAGSLQRPLTRIAGTCCCTQADRSGPWSGVLHLTVLRRHST